MTDKTPRAWDGALEQEFYTPEEIAASDARVGKAHRMIYREKVIKGLEECLNSSCRGFRPELYCPIKEDVWDHISDALALLKAQEPRVMTLEEVKAFEWDYCYLEQERQPGKEYRMIVGDYALTCITWPCITPMRIEYGDSSYGVKWRCWTSRPTDEQREATPWE